MGAPVSFFVFVVYLSNLICAGVYSFTVTKHRQTLIQKHKKVLGGGGAIFTENFDELNYFDAAKWSASSGARPSSQCGPVIAGSSATFFASDSSSSSSSSSSSIPSRYLTTIPLDLTKAVSGSFADGSGKCESSTVDDVISVQFSRKPCRDFQDFGRLLPPGVSQVYEKAFTIPLEARKGDACLRWIQKSQTGNFRGSWGLDHVYIFSAETNLESLDDDFDDRIEDPPRNDSLSTESSSASGGDDEKLWTFVVGGSKKAACGADSNALVFEGSNSVRASGEPHFLTTSPIDLSYEASQSEILLFEGFESKTRVKSKGWKIRGGEPGDSCGNLHQGKALVMKALGSRRFCSPFVDASKSATLRFFLVYGDAHCSGNNNNNNNNQKVKGNNTVAFKVTAVTKDKPDERPIAILEASDFVKPKMASLEIPREVATEATRFCWTETSSSSVKGERAHWAIDSVSLLPRVPSPAHHVIQMDVNLHCGLDAFNTTNEIRTEYSNDYGKMWKDLHTPCLPGSCEGAFWPLTSTINDGLLVNFGEKESDKAFWTRVTFPLPYQVLTPNVMFRLRQSSADVMSHWAIDNLFIGRCDHACHGYGRCTTHGCSCDHGFHGDVCQFKGQPPRIPSEVDSEEEEEEEDKEDEARKNDEDVKEENEKVAKEAEVKEGEGGEEGDDEEGEKDKGEGVKGESRPKRGQDFVIELFEGEKKENEVMEKGEEEKGEKRKEEGETMDDEEPKTMTMTMTTKASTPTVESTTPSTETTETPTTTMMTPTTPAATRRPADEFVPLNDGRSPGFPSKTLKYGKASDVENLIYKKFQGCSQMGKDIEEIKNVVYQHQKTPAKDGCEKFDKLESHVKDLKDGVRAEFSSLEFLETRMVTTIERQFDAILRSVAERLEAKIAEERLNLEISLQVVEERLVNKMDDISDKLNVVQNKLASMDSNVAAAEARRRAALMQSSVKAVERSVSDKIDAVDRRLRQKQDNFEIFERNVETAVEDIKLIVEQRNAKEEKEEKEEERRRKKKDEEEEGRRKEEMAALFNVTTAVEAAFDRWRGDTKEIAGAVTTKMTTTTTKLTELVGDAEERIEKMTKDVGDRMEGALAAKKGSECGEGEKTKDVSMPEKGSMADVRPWKEVKQRMIWRGEEGGGGEGGGGESVEVGRGETEEEAEEDAESGEVDVNLESDNYDWQNHGRNIFSRSNFDFKVGKLAAIKKNEEG